MDNNNAPVNTPPLNNGQNTAESHENTGIQANERTRETINDLRDSLLNNKDTTPPYNAPVVSLEKKKKPAGFGNFLCDNCGVEKKRMVWNHRFCCTPCRMSYHGFTPKNTKRKGAKN